MNYKMVFYTLGNILKFEAAFLGFPLIVSLINKEPTRNVLSFLITLAACLVIGIVISLKKPKKDKIYSSDGFAIVGLSWIVMSLFGCLPFIISKQIPSFTDAFFETVSGFTTTGATIINGAPEELLSHSMLFWRSFTHWIGGMGVLVFILAVMPKSEGQGIYLLRAESTGPQVGKLVSKIKLTATILYLIYIVFTITEAILLWISPSMNFFEAITHAFATAGTGGFGLKADSLASYSTYCQIVIIVFMFLFGINFSLFYLILAGRIKQALQSEELWWYIGIITVCSLTIFLNVYLTLRQITTTLNTGVILKDSFFQVVSFMTSTGFTSADYNSWPEFSKTILITLMFIGACAGSTGGGIKVARIIIVVKAVIREIRKLVHPNSVSNVHHEHSTLSETVVHGVLNYFALIMIFTAIGLLILSTNGFGFESNFTAIVSSLNNIGPIFGGLSDMSTFPILSKFVMIFAMLLGRLELYPILILFSFRAWTNK